MNCWKRGLSRVVLYLGELQFYFPRKLMDTLNSELTTKVELNDHQEQVSASLHR